MTTTFTRLGAVALTAAIVAFTACGSDDDVSISTSPVPSSSDSTHHDDANGRHHRGRRLRIQRCAGVRARRHDPRVPQRCASGTPRAGRVPALRRDDIELDDLVQLPADELGARLGAPVTVLLQPPGSDEQIVAVGDGTLTEPGRYVLMCFIPTGADPEEYLAAAAASEGEAPTGVAGGPPHFVNGMYAELQVDA